MKLLKYTIPLGIIAAGALSLSACSLGGSGDSGAVTAACNGFHQWQSSHDPATLMSATNNLDFWVKANDYTAGGSRYGGGSGRVFPRAFQLDDNMDALNLLVQEGIGDIPAATKNVANNCKGNHGGGGAPYGSSRLVIVFVVAAGIAVLIVVAALALWIGYSIRYRASN